MASPSGTIIANLAAYLVSDDCRIIMAPDKIAVATETMDLETLRALPAVVFKLRNQQFDPSSVIVHATLDLMVYVADARENQGVGQRDEAARSLTNGIKRALNARKDHCGARNLILKTVAYRDKPMTKYPTAIEAQMTFSLEYTEPRN